MGGNCRNPTPDISRGDRDVRDVLLQTVVTHVKIETVYRSHPSLLFFQTFGRRPIKTKHANCVLVCPPHGFAWENYHHSKTCRPAPSPCSAVSGSRIQDSTMQCCISNPPSKPEAQLPVHTAVLLGQVVKRLCVARAVDGTDGTAVCHASQLRVRWPSDILHGANSFRPSHP